MRKNNGVSHALSTFMLLVISTCLFTTTYLLFLPTKETEHQQNIVIVGQITKDNLIFKHQGGEDIDHELSLVIKTVNGEKKLPLNNEINGNSWNIGERTSYVLEEEEKNGEIECLVIDETDNVIIWSGVFNYSVINSPPDKPFNPSPEDEADNVNLNPILRVFVTDSDGDNMDVFFYNASDDSLIGEVEDVSDGDTAMVTWFNLTELTDYSWYAVADDGEYINQSDTWCFITRSSIISNNPPYKPYNPSPSDNEKGISTYPMLRVMVFDPDDDVMDVFFYDNSDDSLIGMASSVDSGDIAAVQWENLLKSAIYSWYAVASDGEYTNRSNNWSFTTNNYAVASRFMRAICTEKRYDEGYDVRITSEYEDYNKSIEEFMSRELFDSCLRTGYITKIDVATALLSAAS